MNQGCILHPETKSNNMKEFLNIAMAYLFSVALIGCSGEQAKSVATETSIIERVIDGNENSTVAFMSIEGMSCEIGCARYINKNLSKTEGVLASEIDFEGNLAKVSFDPEKISAKDLAGIVNKLNDGQYKVLSVEVEQTRKVDGGVDNAQPESKAKSQDNDLEQVGFRSISFPNIQNLFKIKFI